MQQIRKGGSRWDHKRKGHQFYRQRRLIFKLHTKTLLQKHLTCVSLVALIMFYVGQREYMEIPLTQFPPRLFLSCFPGFLSSFPYPFLCPCLWWGTAAAVPSLPSPSPSAVSHFTWLFLLLHSPELNSVTAPWQFLFAGDSGNWIWCLGELPGMMSQLCRKKYPM